MLKWNYRGTQRNTTTTAAPGAFQYTLGRTNVDLNVEFQISRHVTLFANSRNILNETRLFTRESSQTASYGRIWRDSPFGIQSAVGIKGTF
jgi:hypothetical protein